MAAKRKSPAQQFITGRNAVLESLQGGPNPVEKVLLSKGASGTAIQQIRSVAEKGGVPVQWVPDMRLEALVSGVNHQGAVAIVAEVAYRDVDDMLQEIAVDVDEVRATKPFIVALDRIEDPQNFGAILRSVVGVGAAGVIVPGKGMAPVNAHAIKTSAGAALQIPIARTADLAATLESLKERGYWIAGADGSGDTTVWAMDWDRPLVLVIGNEHSGMSTAVKAVCDYLVNIPIPGNIESLNASVAAGILLFAARTQ